MSIYIQYPLVEGRLRFQSIREKIVTDQVFAEVDAVDIRGTESWHAVQITEAYYNDAESWATGSQSP